MAQPQSRLTSHNPVVQMADPTLMDVLPIVDQATADLLYKGYAPLGTKTSDPNWLIIRFNTVGTVTTPEYAGGTAIADSVWDDRASLKYSR